MVDPRRKLDELHAIIVLAKRAARDRDVPSVARALEEMHIQTGLLLCELRKPMMRSARVYDLAAERRARA